MRNHLNVRNVLITSLCMSMLGCAAEEPAALELDGDRADLAPVVPADSRFTLSVIDDAIPGPAFATIVDYENDGRPELLISAFGKARGVANGEVRLYRFEDGFSAWSHTTIVGEADGVKFPNHATAHDIDHDGDLDFLVPHGFLACALPIVGPGHCGGLRWYENLDGVFEPHVLVEDGSELFYHVAEIIDFDGDGIEDLVTTAEEQRFFGSDRAIAQWFKGNDSAERFERQPRSIGNGMGSLPTVKDIDGDGDLDIASAEYFAALGASFAWFERIADPSPEQPAGQFVRHVIDGDSGPSIQLSFVPDLFGDGVTRAIGANHTNTAKWPADPWESAILAYEMPEDPRQPWIRTQLSSGIESRPGSFNAPQAAPGIFGHGDIDNDGDMDILVSGDGDPNVYWLEQTTPGEFDTQVLLADMGQAGAMQITDLDGDGWNELLVSSYERDALYMLHFIGE